MTRDHGTSVPVQWSCPRAAPSPKDEVASVTVSGVTSQLVEPRSKTMVATSSGCWCMALSSFTVRLPRTC